MPTLANGRLVSLYRSGLSGWAYLTDGIDTVGVNLAGSHVSALSVWQALASEAGAYWTVVPEVTSAGLLTLSANTNLTLSFTINTNGLLGFSSTSYGPATSFVAESVPQGSVAAPWGVRAYVRRPDAEGQASYARASWVHTPASNKRDMAVSAVLGASDTVAFANLVGTDSGGWARSYPGTCDVWADGGLITLWVGGVRSEPLGHSGHHRWTVEGVA